MKIKWRGLICLALVSIFSFSSIAPIYALEEPSSETDTENVTVEEEPPEEEVGPDPQTIEEDETQQDTQDIQQDASDAQEVPADPETETPEENAQAQEENEPVETTISKDGLELTGLDLEGLEIQLESDQAKTIKQQLEEDGEEIDNVKAWSFSSPLTGSYEATFELDDDSLPCQLYDTSGTKTKLLADTNDFDGNKVHFEGTDIEQIALVQKASKKKARDAVQPRATARITFNLQDVNATSFTQLRQETVNVGSPLLDIWPSETEVPLTKTVGGTLYMLTFWYDNSSMTTKSIIGNVHGNANFYATYIPARQVTIQNIVNSTDSGALNQTYPITLTATTSSTTGTSGVIVENKGQRYPQSPFTVDFNANETVTMYVPDGATLNATQTDLSSQGFTQYILRNSTLTQGLSSGDVTISANSSPFSLVNSKAPYVSQPAYTYGDIGNGYIGLGMAQVGGPNIISQATLQGNTASINYLDANTVIVAPNQLSQTPANASIQFYEGYPIIDRNNRSWKFASTPDEERMNGYYTITWRNLVAIRGADASGNNFFTPTTSAYTYHLNATINFNADRNVAVSFKVRQPGSTTFTDVPNHASVNVGAGDTLNQASFPTTSQLPATKTLNGVTYQLTSWYTNQTLTDSPNMSQRLIDPLTLYAAYIPINDVYTYGAIKDGNGNTIATMGLGMATASGLNLTAADQATIGTDVLANATTINYPSSYPNITYNGITYSYTSSSTPGTNQYTVQWDTMEANDQIIAGDNNQYTASNDRAYWLNGTITLNPVKYSIQCYVMDPGQTTYTSTGSVIYTNSGTLLSSVTLPTTPYMKTYNGDYYTASIWYTDENCTQPAVFTDPINTNIKLYKQYTRTPRLSIYTRYNGGTETQSVDFTLTSQTNGINKLIPITTGLSTEISEGNYTWDMTIQNVFRFYVPSITTFSVSQSSLASQGYKTYVQWDDEVQESNSLNDIVFPDTTAHAIFINAQAPYPNRTVYTYGQLPDGTYVGLGQAQANAGPMISADIAAANTNYLDFNPTITYPDQITQSPADPNITFTDGYPDITYQGQTYRYAASGSANANSPGYYTINSWDSLRTATSVDQGTNGFYRASNTANYRLNGTLHLNTYNNVTFKLKDAGSNQFTDVANYAPIPLSVQDALSTVAPSMTANKTVNGLAYRFTGWYTNDTLTNAANMNSTISQDTILYGAYVPVMQTLTFTSQNVDGNLDADPNVAFTYRITITPSSNEAITTSNNVRSLGNNVYEVTLSSGQSATLNVPDGSSYTVDQTNPNSMYEPSWQAVNANGTNSGTNIPTSQQQVVGSSSFTFTNRRYSPPPTDFGTSSPAPYVLLGAIIGFSLLLLKRRKQ